MGIEPDYWLGDHLGKPAYRVVGALSDLVAAELPSENAFVEARVDCSNPEAFVHLQNHGFRLVDCNLTLERSADKGSLDQIYDCTLINCRFAAADDELTVRKLAREAFRQNRFHNDPHIPNVIASKIKEEWAGNYFLGGRGDWMVVAENADEVGGFLQLLLGEDGFIVIDLIAVSETFRRQGLARSMISYAFHHCLDFNPDMRVGTQLGNTASLTFYQSIGFKLTDAAYLLHRHS